MNVPVELTKSTAVSKKSSLAQAAVLLNIKKYRKRATGYRKGLYIQYKVFSIDPIQF